MTGRFLVRLLFDIHSFHLRIDNALYFKYPHFLLLFELILWHWLRINPISWTFESFMYIYFDKKLYLCGECSISFLSFFM